jgi:hypothetical protein
VSCTRHCCCAGGAGRGREDGRARRGGPSAPSGPPVPSFAGSQPRPPPRDRPPFPPARQARIPRSDARRARRDRCEWPLGLASRALGAGVGVRGELLARQSRPRYIDAAPSSSPPSPAEKKPHSPVFDRHKSQGRIPFAGCPRRVRAESFIGWVGTRGGVAYAECVSGIGRGAGWRSFCPSGRLAARLLSLPAGGGLAASARHHKNEKLPEAADHIYIAGAQR